MYHFNLKIAALSLMAMIMALPALSQPGLGEGGRNSERIRQMKKIKMLEVLELDESQANQFLVTYDKYEKQRDEFFKKMRKLNEELKDELKDNPDSDKAAKIADDIIESHPEMQKIDRDKFAEMKKILPPNQFAKYVYFEMNFHREVMRAMYKRGKGRHRGGNEPPPRD